MKKKVIGICKSVLLIMVSITGGAHLIAREIATTPCLGCLGLELKLEPEYRFKEKNPNFVMEYLKDSPVFLEYRIDVCSACDKMEPIVKKLENMYPTVKFVHINLDRATLELKNSYFEYDIKGSRERPTGVPMFVIITFNEFDGKILPCFVTHYGIVDFEVLNDDLKYSVALYKKYRGYE